MVIGTPSGGAGSCRGIWGGKWGAKEALSTLLWYVTASLKSFPSSPALLRSSQTLKLQGEGGIGNHVLKLQVLGFFLMCSKASCRGATTSIWDFLTNAFEYDPHRATFSIHHYVRKQRGEWKISQICKISNFYLATRGYAITLGDWTLKTHESNCLACMESSVI